MNGDGKLDLIASQVKGSTPLPTQVLVFPGDGDGTLGTPASVTACAKPAVVKLADLNGDNKLDLAATCAGISYGTSDNGGVAVALGNGNGTFQAAAVLPAGANPTYTSAADITGCNRPDLITSTSEPGQLGSYQIAVHYNKGNGTFQSPVILDNDFGPSGHVVADLTNDGKPDLLVGHCCGDVQIGLYVGNGDGTFQGEQLLDFSEATSVLPVDENNDGKTDVLVSSGQNTLSLLFNGAGTIPGEACTFTLTHTSGVAAPGGDAIGFLVDPSSVGCAWSAASNDSWLTVSNAQRTGGAIVVTAAANGTSALRTSSAVIAGLPVSIRRYPGVAGCSFTLAPQSLDLDGDNVPEVFVVQTGATCQWRSQPSAQWLSANSSGTGPNSFASYFASQNSSGSSPAATIDAGGVKIQAVHHPSNAIQYSAMWR